MRRATGSRKNLLLTLWLLLPFAVLTGIVAVIFLSYGNKKMDARPVGQGARDTGGANALGELLAGNNPIEKERIARDRREGKLVSPITWPHGVLVTLESPVSSESPPVFYLWAGAGGASPVALPYEELSGHTTEGTDASSVAVEISHERLSAVFREGRLGAGIYLADTTEIVVQSDTLLNHDGSEAMRIELGPVPVEQVTEGAPIAIGVHQE